MISGPRNREAAGLVAGFGLWSLTFAVLYGAHGVICAAGPFDESGARMLLIGLWLAMIAAQVGLIVWYARRLRAAPAALRFVRAVSLTLAIAAMVATVWIGVPVVSLKTC